MRRRQLGALAVALLPLVACGLGLTGTHEASDLPDRDGRDGALPDSTVTDHSVVDAASAPDAPEDVSIDVLVSKCQKACGAAGGTCDANGTCVIDCNPCTTRPVCPPDIPCNVTCGASGACDQGVDCGKASSCTVTCDATDSCKGPIVCTGGKAPGTLVLPGITSCNITCKSSGACVDIEANAAGSLINCVASGACKDIECGGFSCTVSNCSGCTSNCCAGLCVGVFKNGCN
jgi:hypothetical protein